HTTRPYGHIVADSHPRENDRISPDPYIITDGHGGSGSQVPRSGITFDDPFGSRHRMTRCIDLYVRSNQSILPYGNFMIVQKHTICIDKGILSNGNVFPIITEKRGFDPHPCSFKLE